MRSLILLMMFSVCSNVQSQSDPSFAQIEIKLDATQSLPLNNRVSFELDLTKSQDAAQELTNWKHVDANHVGNNSLRVVLSRESRFSGEVVDKYLADSFVIDFKEGSIKPFLTGFIVESGQTLTTKNLEKYVHNYIDEPTYINSFNIASLVASQRSGDCTEYAVLLTALARSIGLPSRVVLGTVIIETEESVSAFGHAWSEVWSNGQWQVADAALYELEEIQRFYLPAGSLENEGPGYALSLFSVIGRLPKSISKLRSF